MTLAEVKERSHLLKISTEAVSKIGALGYVLQSGEDMSLRTLEELERDVVGLYGGVAAEELFYGARGISVGSQNDIQKATSMLDMMVNKLSMYSRSKLDYSQFKNKENDLDQVQAKADELYTYTLQSINDYREQINELKDVLMDQYVLSKDAVFALLEEHSEVLMFHLHAPRSVGLHLCAEGAVA